MGKRAEKLDQISIFLENRPGVVADLCAALTEQKINIRALTVLDTIDIGTVRLIFDDPANAEKVLHTMGAVYMVVPVIAVEIKNEPGAFAKVAHIMANEGVNIEYVYASAIGGTERSLGIFRVDNPDRALQIEFP
jgi:hypothetical protein